MKPASLNHAYRLVWNFSIGAFVAVAENVSACGKRSSRALKIATALFAGVTSGVAQAADPNALLPNTLPTGGQIISGQGSISYGAGGQTNNQLTVTQTSDKLITNWNTFNIGEQASVHFQQPNALSAALNRVAAGNPSQILGSLTANGQVYLVNPSGIIFGKNAQVNVGALVASSLNLTNEDFLAGKNNFAHLGNAAAIQNLGNLQGKVIALIAPQVKNDGVITTDPTPTLPLPGEGENNKASPWQGGGREGVNGVALAAGDKVTLDFTGDGLIKIQVDQATLNALAENNGLIKADGGLVILTAQSANALYEAVVNNTGTIQANSLENKNGKIILAGPENGIVQVTGTLDTSGKNSGGEIYVGGGWQGKDQTISQATRTYISENAVLNASATEKGNGGTIAVWSDITKENSVTKAYGTFLANAGVNGGDGGKIETSGHYLDIQNSKGSASANNGKAGEWLLDPRNVTITTANANGAFASAGGTDTWTPTDDSSTILNTDINSKLNAGTNVTVTTGSTGSQSGNITVNSAITKSSGAAATLTLSAEKNIVINSAISSTSGVLNLLFDNQSTLNGVVILKNILTTNGGSLTVNKGIYINQTGGTVISTAGGAVTFNQGVLLASTDGAAYTINTAGGHLTFTSTLDSANTYEAGAVNCGDGCTWDTAKTAATSGNEDGDTADIGDTYLATILSATENEVASAAANFSAAWLGGARIDTADGTTITTDWRWQGGQEEGQSFYSLTKASDGTNTSALYSNWNTGEPNNFQTETRLQFTGNLGAWNDLRSFVTNVNQYIKETNLAASPLVINAGAGAVTFSSAVGTNKSLGALTITSTANTAINGGAITTTGAQTYNGNVILGSAATTLTQTTADTHFLVQPDKSITNAFGDNAALTIKTTGNIELNSGSSIASSIGALTLVLNSDSDATNGGSIWISEGASISTHGGNITMGGGSTPSSIAAKGFDLTSDENNARHQGVTLNGTVNAGGGNISIRGEGLSTTNARGVSIGGALTTSGAGTIEITGIGHGTSDGVAIGDSAIADPAGSISLGTGDMSINGAADDTSANGISISSVSSITSSGDITLAANAGNLSASGAVTADELQVFSTISTTADFTSLDNHVTTLAANVSSNFNFLNNGALTIGHAGSSDGVVSDAGVINIATLTGDLTLAKRVNVGAIPGESTLCVVLNAGKNAAAGTAASGNILVTGEGDFSTPTNGRVILYSGSVSDSTGLTNLIGSASGKFRYNSDETTTNYTTALGSGNYAIYREQPTISITANDASKTYDKLAYLTEAGGNDAPSPVTYSGLVNGDTSFSALTGTLAIGGNGQGAINAGSYFITPSGLTNGLGYAVSHVSGTLTVNPKTLTASYTSSDKIYDGSASATVTSSLTGVIEGDVVTTTQSAAFANKNVGTAKAVSVSSIVLAGDAASNYSVASTAESTAANITAKILTLTGFDAANKIYDGNTTATISDAGTLTGAVGNDVVTVSNTGATFADKNVGTGKTVTLNGVTLAGDDAANYSISTVTDTANITAKTLTLVGFDAESKVYDGNTTATISNHGTLTGAVGNDVVTVSNTGATFADKNVGTGKTVTLNGLTLAGDDAANYSITTATDTADITAAVSTQNSAPASVTSAVTSPQTGVTGTAANSTNAVGGSGAGVLLSSVGPGTGSANLDNLNVVSFVQPSLPLQASFLSANTALINPAPLPISLPVFIVNEINEVQSMDRVSLNTQAGLVSSVTSAASNSLVAPGAEFVSQLVSSAPDLSASFSFSTIQAQPTKISVSVAGDGALTIHSPRTTLDEETRNKLIADSLNAVKKKDSNVHVTSVVIVPK